MRNEGPDSALVPNIMHFARILRAAGLPIGPGRVIEGVRAVEAVGIAARGDLYWALHAVFVNRHDQHEIFDQAFKLFWRDPKLMERVMQQMLPDSGAPPAERGDEASRRVLEALEDGRPRERRRQEEEEQEERDFTLTFSADEVLQKKDFEQMSTAELAQARRAIEHMHLAHEEVRTRRHVPAHAGARMDLRATMRAMARRGGDVVDFRWRSPRTRRPPLVVLCDISGSMERYSRMFLHFLHALTNDRDRVYTFLFGTRLTNVTRALRHRDVDEALKRVSEEVPDWSGGTRIGHCLAEFNRLWARRVLGQGATVLLISDGLDREGAAGLGREIERLAKSCRRLVWLNPLLRFDGFQPKSLGVRAILPHVDEFRPAHNLASLGDIAAALGRQTTQRRQPGKEWAAKEWRAA
jgi:uncharacterized protein with von Willebrand factor type A (vWA) domain